MNVGLNVRVNVGMWDNECVILLIFKELHIVFQQIGIINLFIEFSLCSICIRCSVIQKAQSVIQKVICLNNSFVLIVLKIIWCILDANFFNQSYFFQLKLKVEWLSMSKAQLHFFSTSTVNAFNSYLRYFHSYSSYHQYFD